MSLSDDEFDDDIIDTNDFNETNFNKQEDEIYNSMTRALSTKKNDADDDVFSGNDPVLQIHDINNFISGGADFDDDFDDDIMDPDDFDNDIMDADDFDRIIFSGQEDEIYDSMNPLSSTGKPGIDDRAVFNFSDAAMQIRDINSFSGGGGELELFDDDDYEGEVVYI